MARDDETRVAEAVSAIRSQWSGEPMAAIILGTGLGGLANRIDAERVLDYAQIPHFPRSSALAHAGKLICGRLDGTPVVTMQGRCHLYEGYAASQVALPVQVMQRLGAGTLVVSNASGGVNPQYRMGDIMVLESHVNLMWGAPAAAERSVAKRRTTAATPAVDNATPAVDPTTPVVDRAPAEVQPYSVKLREHALRVARREDFRAHPGVYVAVTGPNYETRAEYRMFRQLGGDAVGMSTVPEVLAAAAARMQVLALSVITNVAKPDAPENVDAEEVVVAAATAEQNMAEIVRATMTLL